MKISLAMIVKNEEKYIKRCLDSVKKLVDEMIVVDTGSSDRTINIVSNYPNVKFYEYKWNDNFSEARNYAIERCSGDYILILDADEYVTLGKRKELEFIANKKVIGQIAVHSNFKKDDQILDSKSYVSRFFPSEMYFEGAIHEQIKSHLPRVKMKFTVKHDGYFERDKGKRNIPLLIKELAANPEDPYYLFQLGKEYRISEEYHFAFQNLVKSYEFVNKNSLYYKELIVELIYSGKELGKDKVLEIIESNEEVLRNFVDFHFAKGLFFLDFCLKNPKVSYDYIPRIENSFLQCLFLHDKDHIEYVFGTSSFLAAFNLGVFYEVTSNVQMAKKYYQIAYKYGYKPAKDRLTYFSNL